MPGADHRELVEIVGGIAAIIRQVCPAGEIVQPPGMQGVFLARREGPELNSHCLERPVAAFTACGRKRITLGQRDFFLAPGKVLVNCVEMPSNSAILEASPERPFLSIFFLLDRKIFSDLAAEMPPAERSAQECRIAAGAVEATPRMGDAFLRLARLAGCPAEAAILAPLALRELHYFLLAGPLGPMLRQLYMKGAADNRILEAIAWLKRKLNAPVSIEALARAVNMSVSSLHRHFKDMTGFSPLQYHKQLRLYEAQRLMIAENERADAAAMAVGYESVAQFNRDYKKMFGEPPRRDINRRKNP